jgi:cation diffusion facilitator CzcD-associated flavoprotein CzcO
MKDCQDEAGVSPVSSVVQRRALPVGIIGSGFSGLAAAIALKRRAIADFTIFEQEAGLGGTWYNNRYPGAEVDLESHIYSYSFEPYDWTRNYASQEELLGYLNHVANKWDIVRHIRFNDKVERVVWSDADNSYTVVTASGASHGPFAAVISAVGFLNLPLLPPFARGATPFLGPQCHTSRWPKGLTMNGKRVGILGTGSSAVQVIAEAVRDAKSVKIFQIEPNWLLPKEARDFTPSERRWHKFPPVYWWKRFKLYAGYDVRQYGSSHAKKGARHNTYRTKKALEYLYASLADRPDLLKLATPAFPFEARRTVISDTYYQDLKNPKVELIPYAVKSLTAKGAVDANGVEHELDLIVYATGFDAANYLGNYAVKGEGGKDLHETWAGEPEALLGLMVPDFPNFFMMYGPNTNSVPLVSFYEAQADFASSLIAKMYRRGAKVVSVKPRAFRRFNTWLQDRLSRTVWGSTKNYFQAGNGKVVSQWPFSASAYIFLTRLARRFAVNVK